MPWTEISMTNLVDAVNSMLKIIPKGLPNVANVRIQVKILEFRNVAFYSRFLFGQVVFLNA